MAGLVTLGSAPYNPYNDSFGQFAMQGLGMGMQMIQHKDNLAQRQSEQLQSIVSEGTQNLFRGQEMQMRNKELNHRIENDLFNRILDTEKLAFTKKAHADDVSFRDKDFSLREKDFDWRKEKWEKYDAPHQVEVTRALADSNKFNEETWNSRVQLQQMEVASKALAISSATQAVQQGALAYDFNKRTQESRVETQNMLPRKTQLEIEAAESQAEFMTPERREELYKTELENKKADTAYKLDRGKYYAGGGAAKDELLARSVEVRDSIGAQSVIQKDYLAAKAKIGDASGKIKMFKSNLESGKIKGDEVDSTKKMIEAEESKLAEAQEAFDSLERQLTMARTSAEGILTLWNRVLLDRGKDPLQVGKMSDTEKAQAAMDAIIQMQKEQASGSGNFPGGNPNAIPGDPYATPAQKAEYEAKKNAPLNKQSKNPPTQGDDEDEAAIPRDD